MPSIVDINIRASGGDYDNIRTAVTAEKTDLVAADLIHRYIIYDDWELGHDYSSTLNYISLVGYTTSETCNIIITCPAGSEANGTINHGTHLRKTGQSYFMVADNQHVLFLGIELSWEFATSGLYAVDNVKAIDCFIHDTASHEIPVLENCLMLRCTNATLDTNGSKNVTMVDCGTYDNQIYFRNASFSNCIAWATVPKTQYSRFFSVTGGSNNATNDNLGDGEVAYGDNPHVVYESDFVDFDNENYNIHPDSPLYTAGVDGEAIGAVLGGVSSAFSYLTIITNVTGADFVILQAGTNNVLESVDQEPTNSFSYGYLIPITVDIGVIKQGYEIVYYYNYLLADEDATIPLNLRYDRNYLQ